MAQKQKLDSQKSALTMVAVGDVSPVRDNPASIFNYCIDVFRKADIRFGHLENPLSEKGRDLTKGSSRIPSKISAFNKEGANFDVMSWASNRSWGYGIEAFVETVDILKKNNIGVIGAGRNIDEARKPFIIERGGIRIGFLDYLSVFADSAEDVRNQRNVAKKDVPGCPPLRATQTNDQWDPQPGTPPRIITELFPEDKQAMLEDVKKLRPQVDVLVFSCHCGVHNVEAVVAMYQKEAAYAAIDAGADLVLQHHAHICKGIEKYKGKTIFYGLGNFAPEHFLDASGNKIPMSGTSLAHREFYGVKPIPGWEKYPYLADARITMIGKVYMQDKNIQKVTYIPCFIRPTLEPEALTRKNPRAQEVFDYIKKISDSQNLKVGFSWEGDEILIKEANS